MAARVDLGTGSYAADWAVKLGDLVTVHGPYLAGSALAWTALYVGSGVVSRWGSPTYRGLPHKLRLQWDTRVVALAHALLICYAAFWGLLFDAPLRADPLHARSSWAYATMVTACGYFLWDLAMCVLHYHEFQLGFLLHAIGCLLTFLGSLVRPPPQTIHAFFFFSSVIISDK